MDGELQNETLPNNSDVVICLNNTWRTVCRGEMTVGWNARAADIACKQLGYLDKG